MSEKAAAADRLAEAVRVILEKFDQDIPNREPACSVAMGNHQVLDDLRPALAAYDAERHGCRTCGAQCEPCATDGRMIAAMEREAAMPTREDVIAALTTLVAAMTQEQHDESVAAVLALFERKG